MSGRGVVAEPALVDVPAGSHVCWVVADQDAFEPIARALLVKGREAREKTVVFGPAGSATRAALGDAAMVADPLTEFLDGGRLEPETMFALFRVQAQRARAEGYAGIRVVADMEWLLPASPSSDQLIAFELLLDRVVHELGATVICAYPARSFDQEMRDAVAAVHPVTSGVDPMFRLSATASGWTLSGEVDFCVLPAFTTAIDTAMQQPNALVDLSGVRFMDCAAMRTLARALAAHPGASVTSVPYNLRRLWELAGFDRVAPLPRMLKLDASQEFSAPS